MHPIQTIFCSILSLTFLFQIPPQRTQIYIYTKCYKQLVEWNFQQLLTEKTEVKASLSHDADSILKADPTVLRI